jgi:hypothetical protein
MKYRGIRCDNGELDYGDFYFDNLISCYLIKDCSRYSRETEQNKSSFNKRIFKVIPESIALNIELVDIFKKQIYSSMIIQNKLSSGGDFIRFKENQSDIIWKDGQVISNPNNSIILRTLNEDISLNEYIGHIQRYNENLPYEPKGYFEILDTGID